MADCLEIFIKPKKKVQLCACGAIYVRDVAAVLAPKSVADAVLAMKLMNLNGSLKKCYLLSVTDIIKPIKRQYPEYAVQNVGEMDTLVDYSPEKPKANPLIKWGKVAVVAVILFTGSSTAIMSFYTDAQLSTIFEKVYEIVFGYKSKNPLMLEIPFALGLSFGVIFFFNHFFGKKITDDPTPIEIQLSEYGMQVSDTLISTLDAQQSEQNSGQKDGGS